MIQNKPLVFTALVTPFNQEGLFNEKVYVSLVQRQIKAGIKGLIPLGTSGESPTILPSEWERIIDLTRELLKGTDVVFGVGTGTNDTQTSIQLTQKAQKKGADFALIVSPYYNKPNQEGLKAHFSKIASSVDFPIMLYNNPGRSLVNIAYETLAWLIEKHQHIFAMKESNTLLETLALKGSLIKKIRPDFLLYSGDDLLTLPMLSLGACGVVSVASNVAPLDMQKMLAAYFQSNPQEAFRLHQKLAPLMDVLFVETNPAPCKAALNLMNIQVGDPRLPLVKVSETSLEKIKNVLKVAYE